MPRLFVRRIESVGAVDEGDNPGASIMFWKKRKFTQSQREAAADKGQAMPSGGFPIQNATDLRNAVQAIGRAKDPPAAKAHIIRRAKALGLTRLLPDGWVAKQSRTTAVAKEGRMPAPDLSQLDEDVRAPIEAYIAELEAMIPVTEPEDVAKDAPPEVLELIAKQNEKIDDLHKALEAERAEKEAEISKARDAEFAAVAKSFPVTLDESDGAQLRAIADAAPEAYEWLKAKLAAWDAQLTTSDLLKEVGRGTGGDRLETLTKEKLAANPKLTAAQARAQVWREHPDLVDDVRS